jgi:predicted transcriptional regulator
MPIEDNMRQKSITLRLPEVEYAAFTQICDEKGYSKTGKIREFIRNMVKAEMREVELSAAEWEELKEGIREVESGEFTTLEDMKRDLARKKMAHNQNIRQSSANDRISRVGCARKNTGADRKSTE